MKFDDADTLITLLRQEFTKQLEQTGKYNKEGMQLAFEKAMTAALARMLWTV